MGKQNPPPVTKAGKSPVAKSTTETMEVDVQAEVLPDGRSGRKDIHGLTDFKPIGVGGKKFATTPTYETKRKDGDTIVSKVNGRATLKGFIRIQTVYGPDAKATDPSDYGRGTTAQDIKAGNTSLGFHESCHQADFLAYLANHPLPEFTGVVGMSVADFKAAGNEFGEAVNAFFKDMDQDSYDKTDEVGYKRSTYDAQGPRS
jgi:hypothetical protein